MFWFGFDLGVCCVVVVFVRSFLAFDLILIVGVVFHVDVDVFLTLIVFFCFDSGFGPDFVFELFVEFVLRFSLFVVYVLISVSMWTLALMFVLTLISMLVLIWVLMFGFVYVWCCCWCRC